MEKNSLLPILRKAEAKVKTVRLVLNTMSSFISFRNIIDKIFNSSGKVQKDPEGWSRENGLNPKKQWCSWKDWEKNHTASAHRQGRRSMNFLRGCVTVYGILVPPPGVDPGALAGRAPSPKHWTTREFPRACTSESDGEATYALSVPWDSMGPKCGYSVIQLSTSKRQLLISVSPQASPLQWRPLTST